MSIFMLVTMIFCHIADDYYLQGWLAQAKQRNWWKKNAPDELYKNDYKMALAEHAFSWSFMIHIPIMAYLLWIGNSTWVYILAFCVSFVANWIIHAIVGDLKANKLKINLIQDQMIHFVQVFITWIVWATII